MKYIAVLLLALAASPAFAQSNSNSNSSSDSASNSGAVSELSGNQSGANAGVELTYAPVYEASQPLKNQYVKGAAGIGLSAAVSFSSDYCGGTNGGGASGWGVNVAVSKVTFDKNCQALRQAEKLGGLAATSINAGYPALGKALLMAANEAVCYGDPDMRDVCTKYGLNNPALLMGSARGPSYPPAGAAIIRGSNGQQAVVTPAATR